MGASAQKARAKNTFGISIGAGFSNLFFGNPFDSDNKVVSPLLGGGATIAFEYELEYKHLLVHTGFGIDYTMNNQHVL